jgi:hypothetical protein
MAKPVGFSMAKNKNHKVANFNVDYFRLNTCVNDDFNVAACKARSLNLIYLHISPVDLLSL